MASPSSYLEFETRDQWRAWLAENHASAAEAWLALYKKRYADQGLTLDEATEEAQCFGWIDGQLKSLDERRYTWLESAKTEKTRQTRIHTILKEIHGH